jgi:hypothetical protein
LGTFVFVRSGHVGVSMFIIVIKLIILITLVTKKIQYFSFFSVIDLSEKFQKMFFFK